MSTLRDCANPPDFRYKMLRGNGCAPNAKEAFRLFQLAADGGYTGGLVALSNRYADGQCSCHLLPT